MKDDLSMKPLISCSILSADFAHLKEQIHTAEEAGADWIHIDVMDGHFVPNISMGPFIVETCRRITELPLDVHLMIEKPELHIEDFINAGANWVSVHVEGNPGICRTLQHIRSLGCKPSIVLNPGTPASSIEAVLDTIDMVLVMTVNPGYSGQAFLPGVLPKIKKVYEMLQSSNPDANIQIDGGISEKNLQSVLQSGANVIVAATSIFKYPDGIAAGIQALRKAANR
jgi:ribulose-phosphate 3-epimerase